MSIRFSFWSASFLLARGLGRNISYSNCERAAGGFSERRWASDPDTRDHRDNWKNGPGDFPPHMLLLIPVSCCFSSSPARALLFVSLLRSSLVNVAQVSNVKGKFPSEYLLNTTGGVNWLATSDATGDLLLFPPAEGSLHCKYCHLTAYEEMSRDICGRTNESCDKCMVKRGWGVSHLTQPNWWSYIIYCRIRQPTCIWIRPNGKK